MRARSRRVPVVLQATRFDCGAACLAAVLAAHGRAVSRAEVLTALDPGRDGISALELRDEARRRGLACRGLRVADDLAAHARLPLPFVAHWDGDHYVVVTRIGRRGVEVMDPAIGRRRLAPAAYLAGVTGVVLTFGAGPSTSRRHREPPATRSAVRAIVGSALLARPSALVTMALASLLLLGVGLAVPVWTARAVDAFAAGGADRPAVAALLVPVVGVVGAAGVLMLARGLAAAALQRTVGAQLTGAFVEKVLAAPMPFVERRGPGELVSRILAADALRDALATRLIGAVLDVVAGVGYLIVVAVASPGLGAVTAGLGAAQLLVLAGLAVRGRRLRREELLAAVRSNAWLLEVAGGLSWVKAAGAEQVARQRSHQLVSRQLAALHEVGRNSAVAEAAAAAIRTGGPLALLVTAAWSSPSGSPGTVVALAALAAAALVPLGTIATHLRELYEIGSVVDHLQDLAEAPTESAPGKRVLDRLDGGLSARGLGFRFTSRDRWTVDGVSFDARPGSKIAVVGPSGSGKSTLARLLVGLYRPTVGSVAFDGNDLDALDLPSVRRLTGVVWQDPLLFSGTIRDNITLRVPDASHDAVREAARLAAIDTDIAAMPMGYETRLGPSGEGLSGGQRQRLALARALVGAPSVLVLDEATSHLDTPTEALVEQGLRRAGVTRIVIAHRLSTVADADLILVMSAGRVIEQGTHEDLLRRDGAYARMVGAQQALPPAA